jgi:HK97 gp10 family phage protein
LIKAQFIGLDQFKNKINSAKAEIKKEIDAELQASAMQFVGLAKKDLSNQAGDTGTLLGSITYKPDGEMVYTVFVEDRAYYAPYIEFGTRGYVKAEPGFEEVAQQFKGKRKQGTLKLIDAIKAWVIRKGIETEEKEINRAAFAIARSIYKNGIEPRPFFYKQVAPVRKSLINRVKTILNGV